MQHQVATTRRGTHEMESPMKVAVIGTGYVGLTTGVALAFLGHDVVGVDSDPAKLEMMRAGRSPIHEQGLEELMAHVGARLSFEADTKAVVGESEIIMIAVGTPSREDGSVDVTYVEQAAKEVAEGLLDGRSYTIIVKSTVPIGTNRRVANIIRGNLEDRGVKAEVCFASNPEFLREGKALQETLYPDCIVVGADGANAREMMR